MNLLSRGAAPIGARAATFVSACVLTALAICARAADTSTTHGTDDIGSGSVSVSTKNSDSSDGHWSMTGRLAYQKANGGGGLTHFTLSDTSAGAAGKRPAVSAFAGDARMARSLNGVAMGRSVKDVLPVLSRVLGVPIAADRNCGDQKITLILRGAPASESLDRLAINLGFQWEREKALKSGAEAGYHLTQDSPRARLAATLRRAAARQRAEHVLRRLELAIRALDAGPEEMSRIRAEDPRIIDLVSTSAGIRARIRLASTLSTSQREVLAAGGRCVSAPMKRLDPSLREVATYAGGLERSGRDLDSLRLEFFLDQHDGGDAVLFRVIDEDSRPVGSGGGVTYGRAPRRQAMGSVIRSATSPARDPHDPMLNRTVLLRGKDEKPLTLLAGLPALLRSLAGPTGLNVLADHYDAQAPRFDVEPLGARPAWQIANIIADQFGATWERRDTYLVLRNREWYELEPEEIPSHLLDDWRASTPLVDRVTAAAFVETVASLREEQLAGLQYQFRGARIEPPYAWAAILGDVPAAQRRALVSGVTLEGRSLTQTARARLGRLLNLPGDAVTLDSQARLQVDASPAEITVCAALGSFSRRHSFALPRKGPLLPPIQFTSGN